LGTERPIKQSYEGEEILVNGPIEGDDPGFSSFRNSLRKDKNKEVTHLGAMVPRFSETADNNCQRSGRNKVTDFCSTRVGERTLSTANHTIAEKSTSN